MLPRVQPIAPIRRKEPFDDPDWLFDLKYDGFRALCYLEQGGCRMISRNGNLMSRFDGLSDRITASLDVGDAILDGEVIAADATGRPQFYDLLWDARALAYVAFDLIWLNGADLRALPLTERRRHLQNILPKGSAVICEALSVTGTGHKLFELMCAHDLESIVAKRLKDPYEPRARWVKIENPGYSQNEGRRELYRVRRANRRRGGQDHRRLSGGELRGATRSQNVTRPMGFVRIARMNDSPPDYHGLPTSRSTRRDDDARVTARWPQRRLAARQTDLL